MGRLKKGLIIFLLFLVGGTLTAKKGFVENLKGVQLRYEFIKSNNENGITEVELVLKAKNISTNPIYNTIVKLKYIPNGLSITTEQIYFGDLEIGQISSSPSFFIKGDSKVIMQSKMIWQVEYTDINGNRIIEESILGVVE